ncbi:ABC transporter ATP-binding protein [Lachnospiraceae bacterium 54-53]
MELCNAIEVRNVSKSFKIFLDKGHTLKEKFLFRNRRQYEERKVLKDISFEVKKGQGLGLIGHNGCGKSTMLKMLTKIMYPDSGTIEMRGRVSSLIELGAGFHPDMSGRQNIYTNASIFGLTKKEIDARLDDIIAFSELEEFIDNPVRTYSSGMYMRLAFSVAINVDADILLIDEILAVGDAAFQEKCFNKLKEIKAKGTTVVIVSHSLSQIEEICEKSIWIHNGNIKEIGYPKEVHEKYMKYVMEKRVEVSNKELLRKRESKELVTGSVTSMSERMKILDVKMLDKENNEMKIFRTNDSCKINISYDTSIESGRIYFIILIKRIDGVLIYSINMKNDEMEVVTTNAMGEIDLVINDLLMLPGLYFLEVVVQSEETGILAHNTQAYKFEVISMGNEEGIVKLDHRWSK